MYSKNSYCTILFWFPVPKKQPALCPRDFVVCAFSVNIPMAVVDAWFQFYSVHFMPLSSRLRLQVVVKPSSADMLHDPKKTYTKNKVWIFPIALLGTQIKTKTVVHTDQGCRPICECLFFSSRQQERRNIQRLKFLLGICIFPLSFSPKSLPGLSDPEGCLYNCPGLFKRPSDRYGDHPAWCFLCPFSSPPFSGNWDS